LVTVAGDSKAASATQMSQSHTAFLKANCLSCHSADRQEGSVRLDDMPFNVATVEQASRWQKVLEVLNAGQMPPEDEPQPSNEAKITFLDALSREMVAVRAAIGDAGGRMVMRRLNRREYAATIRDLLGVEVKVDDLPSDVGTGGFDTVGSALFISADQLEKYLEIGREAGRRAVAAGLRPAATRVRFEPESREQDRNESMTIAGVLKRERDAAERYEKWQADPSRPITEFGFKHETEGKTLHHFWNVNHKSFEAYLALPHLATGSYLTRSVTMRSAAQVTISADAPSGDYVLRVRAGLVPGAPRERQFIDLMSNPIGERFTGRHEAVAHVTGTIDQPEIYEFPLRIEPDSNRVLTVTEKRNHRSDLGWLNSLARAEYKKPEITPGDPHRAIPWLWVDWVEWEGPLADPAAAGRVFTRGPEEPHTADYGREIVESFVAKAFRGRPPEREFVEKIVAFRERQQAEGKSFSDSIVEALAVVLASPSFLYLAEPLLADSDPSAATARRELTDQEFAVRLAYFLQGGPPDERLLAHARSGDLRTADVLHAEVERLLDDPRSRRFVEGFVSQWLHLEKLDFFQFDLKLHEKFDDATKQSAREQVVATVQWILDENETLRNLLDSRVAVVDEVLAEYYGLPEESFAAGSPCREAGWRLVELPEGSPRGGLLGMAGILAIGSNGKRTSPVERGAFILRRLLYDPPPPAPANVPQLSRLDGKPMAARNRIAAHMEQAQCAYCHRKIDPPGYALEHFDAVGRWRDQELDPANRTWPIDSTGTLPDGAAFQGADDLKRLLVERSGGLVRGLARALLEYAVGRPVGFSDAETVDALVVQCRADDDRLRSLVHAIVAHPTFATK
jgi:hypothetical protein